MTCTTVNKEFTIFAGTANPDLVTAIARELDVEVGACGIGRFPAGEFTGEKRHVRRVKKIAALESKFNRRRT